MIYLVFVRIAANYQKEIIYSQKLNTHQLYKIYLEDFPAIYQNTAQTALPHF